MPEREVVWSGRRSVRAAAWLRTESVGLALLSAALLFNAVTLPDEARVNRMPANDDVFHAVASQRLGEAIAAGEPFLDPWVADWGLGFPVWRTYQPLPHLFAAPFVVAAPAPRRTEVFAVVAAIVRGLLPLSVWAGARLFGLTPLASGIAALIVLMPSGPASFGHFGLGSDAYAYAGPGVYTQQFAFLFLPLAIGAARRALDTGRRRLAVAALLSATLLSHFVFGYAGALAAVVLSLVGPGGERPRRLVRLLWIAAGSILLTAWFTVPLWLARSEISHSRWEPAWKWDSFGSRAIASSLLDGTLLDSGRLPVLTVLLAAALAGAFVLRRDDGARRLLALTVVLFGLFLGRDTWGRLLLLFGIPGDLHVHRLQAAFELAACLLVAWSLGAALTALRRVGKWAAALGAVVCGVAFGLALQSRAASLRESSRMGFESLNGWNREAGDVRAAFDDVRRLLRERPGRMTAGPASGWGGTFKAGEVRVFMAAALERFDAVSLLFHAMSRAGDEMFQRALDDPGHDDLFALRAVVAPSGLTVPGHYREVGRHGRFVVYEASQSGYFGLGDVFARYTGKRGTESEASASWLGTPASRNSQFVALRGGPSDVPAFGRWEPVPPASPSSAAPRGEVVAESAGNGRWQARVRLMRPCWVVLKVTWFPDLRFSVDGRSVPSIRVTPGFPAVALDAGDHVVEVVYRSSPLKPILFASGIAAFAALAFAARSARCREWDERLASAISRLEERLAVAVPASAVVLAGLVVLSCRALLRGLLVKAHDATIYPPRLVEFARAVLEGHVPPVWAPDLGNGFGQPLFAFAPPLVYIAQLPFHVFGARLADAIQLSAFALVLVGAWATYRLALDIPVSRRSALGAAAFWLFVPYLHTDLFVRGAFAEAAALAAAPLAFLAFWRFLGARPTAGGLAAAAAAIAAVVLGHNALALLFIPALGIVAAASFLDRASREAAAWKAGAAIGFGLVLSAFFWLPAMAENDLVKTSLLRSDGDASFWALHFPTPGQLLYSPWGFGVSVPGPGDGMSFMIGPLHLLAGAAGLWAGWRRGGRVRALAVGSAAAAGLGVFLASPLSAFVWRAFPLLQYFIYPWRALSLPAVFLPVLAALALDALSRQLSLLAAVLVVLLNLGHTEPVGFLTFDDEYYSPEGIAARGINTTTFEEYEPRGVGKRPPHTPLPLSAPTGVEFVEASETAARRRYVVRLAERADVEAALFWYPGWRVTVDGRHVPASVLPERGTFSFPVDRGEHEVSLTLHRTPLRTAALAASALAALLLFGTAAVASRRSVVPERGRRARTGPQSGLAVIVFLAVLAALAARAGRRETEARRTARNAEIRAKGREVPLPDRLLPATPAQAAVLAEALMKKGMDLLYAKHEPAAAAALFRSVLAMNPAHYGATYQLAVALEHSGNMEEARAQWTRALRMAESFNDGPTIEMIRPHLAP